MHHTGRWSGPTLVSKDAGYIIESRLACSALWGNLQTTISLERYDKEWTNGKVCGSFA